MSVSPRTPAGTYPWVTRLGCVLAMALATTLAVASFVDLIGRPSLEVLVQGGVFAAQPDLLASLEAFGLTYDQVLHVDLGIRAFGTATFLGVGGFLAVKRFREHAALLVGAALVVLGVAWFAPLHVLDDGFLQRLSAVMGAGLPFAPETGAGLAMVMLVALLLVFPDGRVVPAWARWSLVVAAAVAVTAAAAPGTVLALPEWPVAGQMAVTGGLAAFALGAQLHRYAFRSSPRQRDQSRLVVGAICAIAAARLLLGPLNPGLGAGLSDLTVITPAVVHAYDLFLVSVIGLAMLSLPLSVGATILRRRLWDIDRLVSRTLAYGAVTSVLVAAYVSVVAVVGRLFQGSPAVAVAAATLAVAFAFQPLRARLQDVIDRRFYRHRYDAARTVREFATFLRDQVELSVLAEHTVAAVDRAVLPAGVSFWVPAQAGTAAVLRRIAFDTNQPVAGADFDTVALDQVSIETLLAVRETLDLREEPAETAPLMAFRELGIILVVPLVSQGELVGLINLGPRMSEADYSLHDLELLTELAGYAAAAVRVALLVREREADLTARERHQSELALATEIQRLLLPTTLPEVSGWWFDGSYLPATEVGGDFYDFLPLGEDRLCIVAGDVTGHGVPSALVMATTQTMLRSEAPRTSDPAVVLNAVNDRLVDELPAGMFVTCLVAMLDVRTGRVRIANAGHNLPYVRGERETREVRATGMPLGLLPGVAYECVEVVVAPGETMLLHSDGLAEAHGPDGMFGFPRVLEVFARCGDPAAVIPDLLTELREHTGPDRPQEDDISLVVVHHAGIVRLPDEPARSSSVTTG